MFTVLSGGGGKKETCRGINGVRRTHEEDGRPSGFELTWVCWLRFTAREPSQPVPPSRFPSLSIYLFPSFSLFYLFSSLLLLSPLSSLFLFLSYMYSLLLQCTPFFSSNHLPNDHLPAARSCLTSLPLYPLFFPPPPTVHQFNRECLLLSRSIRISLFRFLRPSPSIIFYLSFAACFVLFPFSALVLLLLRSSRHRSIPPSPSDSACIPVSGSLSISVKRHPRLSFVRTNLDLKSLYPSLYHFFPFLSHPLCVRSI